jgi:catechol 2,3-dioxygenase-like lactoylglutathione lyase family enzyme
MLRNPIFHHIEIPCDDLEVAERFYCIVLGAKVYMRHDASRRADVPIAGNIAELEEAGFSIDATYMKIGDSLRIGFLKRQQDHARREIDHLAFVLDEEDMASLWQKFTEIGIEVIELRDDRIVIRDPFGLVLELWPSSVMRRLGFL